MDPFQNSMCGCGLAAISGNYAAALYPRVTTAFGADPPPPQGSFSVPGLTAQVGPSAPPSAISPELKAALIAGGSVAAVGLGLFFLTR